MPDKSAAQTSELRFQELLDAIELAIWVSDIRRREVLYISPAYERIWGRPGEDFRASWDAWKQWVHPDDAERVFACSEEFFSSSQVSSYDLTYRIIRPDGSVRFVRDRGFKLPGGPEGIIYGVATDITPERTASLQLEESEKRARQSEELYRNLIDLCPEMIAIHQDGQLVLINKAGVRLLGAKSADELIGKEVIGLVHPNQRERAVMRINTLLSGGTVPPVETTLYRLDGTEIEVEISGALCEFQDRPAIQLVGRDLSARREAERAARAYEANLIAVINARSDWVLAVDREGRIVTLNRAAEEAIELYTGSKYYTGRSVFDWAPEDSARRFRERIDRAFRGETFRVEQPFDFLGRTLIFDISFAPVVEAGEITSVSVICRDITEQAQAQKKLEESDRRFKTLVEGLRLIAYEFDCEQRLFRYVSPLAEKILGYREEEWYRPGFWKNTLHPDDREQIASYAFEKEQAGEDHQMQYRMMHADGSVVWIRDIVSVVRENNKPTRLHGVFIDITEQQALEEQLMQKQKMEAIITLAGGIAHDFNNLLSAIVGFAETLTRSKRLSSSDQEHVAGIVKAAEKAASLTSQLLTFARQKEGERQLIDVNDLITGMKDLFVRLLGEKCKVKLELAQDLALIKADPVQIEQVLLNLAINARDAMPNGGTLTITTENVHVCREAAKAGMMLPGSFVGILFRDTGEGVPNNFASRVFEPFFTTKPVGKGVGLGLAVCHGVVSNHGGTISLRSVPGQGTVLKIHLPAAKRQS